MPTRTFASSSGGGSTQAALLLESGSAAKTTALSALSDPIATDLLYAVDDPAGTAASKKLAISDLLATNVALSEVSMTGGATLSASAYGKLHIVTVTSADATIVLPTAVGHSGEVIGFLISLSTTKLITLDGNSSETLQGATTRIFLAGETVFWKSDGSNFVKLSYNPVLMRCEMHLSADAANITHNTVVKIAVDTTDIDNSGRMADTTNKRINIVRAGDYTVTSAPRVIIPTTAAACVGIPQVNGTGIGQTSLPNSVVTGAIVTTVTVCPVSCVAADYIEMSFYQNSGSTATADGSTLDNGAAALIVQEVIGW